MMIVRENIEFKRGQDPKKSLELGYRGLIKKWFEDFCPWAEYEIDANLKIFSGDLWIEGKNITPLPDNLTVRGFLHLKNTNITSLPNNLNVMSELDINGTEISSLPDDLKVGKSLDIRRTKITSLPDNLKVGGTIYKDF